MTLLNTITAAMNNIDVNEEVAMQRQAAKDRIGNWEGAQALVNKMLDKMPTLVGGEVFIHYQDDRGNHMTKTEAKNDILWLISLQSTLEAGFITANGLVSLFRQWAKDHASTDWDIESCKKVVKGFIWYMKDLNIIDIKVTQRSVEGAMVSGYKLTDATFKEREEAIEQLRIDSAMICKPLLNQPMDWEHARKGVGELANLPLITGQVSNNNHIDQRVLNAVNKLQSVKFMVNPSMARAARLIMTNAAHFDVTTEDVRVFTELPKYRKDSFYFPVTMDTRGRMYYRGGVITPQGEDFCKAAFQFADSKPLGERGFEAIAIHTANVLGMDKVSINDRIAYVQANIDSGTFAKVKDFRDIMELFPDADRFQATVAVLEINRIMALGIDPALVESNLVCHQDGTCNGLQHMAAITGNRTTAQAVNCTASTRDDKPTDIYGLIAEEAANITNGDICAIIKRFGRSMAKNPVMITSYGAGETTVISNTEKYLTKKQVNGAMSQAIGEAYNQAITNKCGAVRDFTRTIKFLTTEATSRGYTQIEWTTADGFQAATEYKDLEPKRVRAGNFNAIISADVEIDLVKTVGAMPPNLIHGIDATHLRMVINDCNHDLVTVHDSIGSRPCDFFTTAESIREQFAVVHEYDQLGNLCENFGTDEFDMPEFIGDYDASEALESTYIFS